MGLSAAGAFEQFQGGKTVAKANEKAEKAREAAMNLDAKRRQRQVIREAQLARSTALANATNQGAQESSGLAGGQAQITSQQNDSILGIQQNQELGTEIFRANKQQQKGLTQQSIGSAFQSVGGALMQNRGSIERVGTLAFG